VRRSSNSPPPKPVRNYLTALVAGCEWHVWATRGNGGKVGRTLGYSSGFRYSRIRLPGAWKTCPNYAFSLEASGACKYAVWPMVLILMSRRSALRLCNCVLVLHEPDTAIAWLTMATSSHRISNDRISNETTRRHFFRIVAWTMPCKGHYPCSNRSQFSRFLIRREPDGTGARPARITPIPLRGRHKSGFPWRAAQSLAPVVPSEAAKARWGF
jgi:hypothetical protein